MLNKWQRMSPRSRCYLMSGVVLVAGLAGALAVYLANVASAPHGAVYDLGYGSVVAVSPDNSKKFIHDLEVYGGKANVLIYRLSAWFQDRWQGVNLAYTIAFLSVAAALVIYYLAGYLPAEQEPPAPAEQPPEKNQGRQP